MIVSAPNELLKIDSTMGCNGALFALCRLQQDMSDSKSFGSKMPDAIVGHGAAGSFAGKACDAMQVKSSPAVWGKNILRHPGAAGYEVVLPEYDERARIMISIFLM